MKKSLFILLFSSAVGSVVAQEVQDLEVQYNPNSLNPIPVYEQHYKVRVWRNLDLKEKQNKDQSVTATEAATATANSQQQPPHPNPLPQGGEGTESRTAGGA